MVDWHDDQAAGLRRLVKTPLRRVIAVASANPADSAAVVAAAAFELTARGARVLVIDEYEGAQSIAAALQCATRYDLLQAARGDVSIARATVRVSNLLSLLPAARAAASLHQADAGERASMARCVELAEQGAEFVLIRAAVGAEGLSLLARAASRVVLAVQGHAAGLTDGYLLLKQVHAVIGHPCYAVVLTRLRDAGARPALIANLQRVTGDRLDALLTDFGSLPVPREGQPFAFSAAVAHGAALLADQLERVESSAPQRPTGGMRRLLARAGLSGLMNSRSPLSGVAG